MAKPTAKQIRFCEEYLKDFNAARAAIAAGYSEDTAKQIGYENLTKPYLKAIIDKRLAELQLSAEETSKMMSDIAKSSLNDYFTIKKVEHSPRIEVGLKQLIHELQQEIIFEDEFASKAGYNEDEMKYHAIQRAGKKRQILRYQLQLKVNPKATKIIDGPVEWVEVAELDLVKIVADKEKGKIKLISPTQYGVKIELRESDTALANVAKMHGLFAKDNAQLKPEISAPLNDSQVEKILNEIRAVKTH